MANRLSPESRNPIAAPGRMACAMASPTSDIRRSIRNTPIGQAPSASANAPASARRMNSNSVKGAIKIWLSVDTCLRLSPSEYCFARVLRRERSRTIAGAYDVAARAESRDLLVGAELGVLIEGLTHAARGVQVFRREHARGAAPSDGLARQEQRLRKVCPHKIDIVHGGEHGTLLAMPAPPEIEQVGRGLDIDCVERLVEHDNARVLQQEAREQHPLHLAAREGGDDASLETGEAHGVDCLLDRDARGAIDAAERSGAPPEPHRHHVVDVDREGAVDLGRLREVSDVLRVRIDALDAASPRVDDADDASGTRRFARPV